MELAKNKEMNHQISLDLIAKTMDDLSVGVGIFYIPDLNDIYNIQYVFMNKVLLSEVRKTRDEVCGKKIIEVAPEAYEHEGGRMVIETYRRVAKEGGSSRLGLVEYSNHLVAGTYDCSVHYIQDHYVYVQLRNVTELEKALKDNKALQQFNYITSHDLKEPLNTIISFSNLLEDEKEKLGEIGQKSIEVIKSSASRMKDFITALLEYSEIGKQHKKTEVDIGHLIDQLKIDLSDLIANSKASVNYLGRPFIIRAFEQELIKLFQNLVENSIKYTEKPTRPIITINSEEQNDCYQFSITDNGIGIPQEQFEKIFDVFQRLHPRHKYTGTGIGLSHCKKVVELHQGKIWLTSEEGRGTTFYFTMSK